MNLEEGMPHPSAVGDKEGAFVDQGYTSEQARRAAQEAGLEWVVVKLAEATKGLILLPRRWVVERSFGWAPVLGGWCGLTSALEVLAGLYFVAFAMLMLARLLRSIAAVL